MEPSKVQSLFSEAAASTSGDDTSTNGGQGGSGQGQQSTQSGQQGSQKSGENQQSQQSQSQGAQTGQEQKNQSQQSQAKVELTPEQLADAFALAQQKHQASQQTQQQQRQPTKEELDKLFNRFEVTPEFFAKIFDSEKPEVAIAALNEFKQATVREALTMAMHLIQDNIGQFRTEVKPYLSFADQQRELVLRDRYFAKFPKHKGMDPIIEQVHQQLKTEGYKPGKGGVEELFDEVGKRVDAIVAQLQAAAGGQQQQSNGSGQQQQQQQGSSKPGMSSLRSGGQGGEGSASSSSSGTTKESKVKRLWS